MPVNTPPIEELERIDIRAIAFDAIKRARAAGESQEMLARWISEDVRAALPQLLSLAKLGLLVREGGEEVVEKVARIINPNAWRVMDASLRRTQVKYRGQDAGYDPDQFKHDESMATARAVLRTLEGLVK